MRKPAVGLILAATLLLGTFACSSQVSETPKAPAVTAAAPQKAEASAPAQASPAPKTAASPASAAAPVPAPTTVASGTAPLAGGTRGEPKGQLVYFWQTSVPPLWLDPQDYPAGTFTPFVIGYLVHDAMIKPMPGNPYAPSLAESYEIAPDFKSATFKLRQGIKFHNGEPVTPEDVQFTFEKYRGGNAKALKDKTERLEIVDSRTVRFVFKEPFLDFLILYGSPASSAGWIVPKKYYEQVGPDGFKQNPVGAGPYKLVRQVAGAELEFEAFTDFWRKTPSVKTILVKGVAEGTTHVAALQAGDADVISLVPGQLVDTLKQDPRVTLAPTQSSAIWIEFVGFEKPDSPFHDKRVRQAVSLVLDRRAISEAEEGGLSTLMGNWLPENWPGAIKGPAPEYNVARAKQLMAEAGFREGFEVESLTPFPPFYSLGERVITALREIGIRTRLNQMERAAYSTKVAEGPGALTGLLIHFSSTPGDAAGWIRSWATCNGASSRLCLPEIDEKLQRYDRSTSAQEREQLVQEIQTYMIDNYFFVPIYRRALINAYGPRIANQRDEIFGAVPASPVMSPYEDVRLKE